MYYYVLIFIVLDDVETYKDFASKGYWNSKLTMKDDLRKHSIATLERIYNLAQKFERDEKDNPHGKNMCKRVMNAIAEIKGQTPPYDLAQTPAKKRKATTEATDTPVKKKLKLSEPPEELKLTPFDARSNASYIQLMDYEIKVRRQTQIALTSSQLFYLLGKNPDSLNEGELKIMFPPEEF